MRVKIKIERTTVEEAEVEFELEDGTELDGFDFPAEADGLNDAGELRADWSLVQQTFDAEGEPEVVS